MKKAYDIFIWCVTGLFIGAIFLLPESVPVHWNGNWEIDRYGSRYTLIILAIIPILLYYGMLLAKKVDPKRHNFQSREKTYDLFRYGLSFFFILLCCFFYYMTFFPKANGEKIMLLLLGILIIGMGNYMPRLPQNYFFSDATRRTSSRETSSILETSSGERVLKAFLMNLMADSAIPCAIPSLRPSSIRSCSLASNISYSSLHFELLEA